MVKRVNFNMEPECHTLLKGVCALKGVTVSEYVHACLNEAFIKLLKEDEQVRNMFMAGNYRQGCKAYILKQSLIEELNQSNDSSA
mgnify:CR=1 FL=1